MRMSWNPGSGFTPTSISVCPTFRCQERNHCLCLCICLFIVFIYWSGLTVTIMSMFPTFQCQERNHCLCFWICIGIFHCICICIFPCLGQFSQPPSSACPQHSSVRRETTEMPVREKLGGMLVGDADKKVECRLKLKW